jgi:hypothetical protein
MTIIKRAEGPMISEALAESLKKMASRKDAKPKQKLVGHIGKWQGRNANGSTYEHWLLMDADSIALGPSHSTLDQAKDAAQSLLDGKDATLSIVEYTAGQSVWSAYQRVEDYYAPEDGEPVAAKVTRVSGQPKNTFRKKKSVSLHSNGAGHVGQWSRRDADGRVWEEFVVINHELELLGRFHTLDAAAAAAQSLLQADGPPLVAIDAGESAIQRYRRLVTFLKRNQVVKA